MYLNLLVAQAYATPQKMQTWATYFSLKPLLEALYGTNHQNQSETAADSQKALHPQNLMHLVMYNLFLSFFKKFLINLGQLDTVCMRFKMANLIWFTWSII